MRNHFTFPQDPLTAARALLEPDEKLIWAEFSSTRSQRRRVVPALIFGLVFTGFSAFWIWSAVTVAGSFLPFLFGLPFLAAGVFLTCRPFLPGLGRRSLYAITDRRLMIAGGGRRKRVASYGAEELGEIEVYERGDGTGDVIFRREERRHRRRNDYRERIRRIGFFGIPEPHRVGAAIAELKAQSD